MSGFGKRVIFYKTERAIERRSVVGPQGEPAEMLPRLGDDHLD